MNFLRQSLRRQPWWVELRDMQQEGWDNARRRLMVQRRILITPSMQTGVEGNVEVRVVTWRRDWVNTIWALKTFYYYSGVDWPLFIHDGGLTSTQRDCLQDHFPNAVIVSREQSDVLVEMELKNRGLHRALAYRRKNASTKKLFDYFLLSSASEIVSIDSDILFFAEPTELIHPQQPDHNLYNRDCRYWYSMNLEELEDAFGFRPLPLINSGLSRIHRRSINLEQIDQWLDNQLLFENDWVTEQTLHAMASTQFGVNLLPARYAVSTDPGFDPDTVCKHYPGFFRPLLYQEGMMRLLRSGFLDQLCSPRAPEAARLTMAG